ncbi:PTS lactose/cellobiose transporter subunit IIA, partial [Bacillus mycoides]|uniref:PTS lactose/cellobiose transporter subunit IIA n=1 Tax=Bacillus mycoides TaxID=1405 RepID=UPI0011A2D407
TAQQFHFQTPPHLINKPAQQLSLPHNTQTNLIHPQFNRLPTHKTFLIIHPQDHLITPITEQKFIQHMIPIIKKLP